MQPIDATSRRSIDAASLKSFATKELAYSAPDIRALDVFSHAASSAEQRVPCGVDPPAYTASTKARGPFQRFRERIKSKHVAASLPPLREPIIVNVREKPQHGGFWLDLSVDDFADKFMGGRHSGGYYSASRFSKSFEALGAKWSLRICSEFEYVGRQLAADKNYSYIEPGIWLVQESWPTMCAKSQMTIESAQSPVPYLGARARGVWGVSDVELPGFSTFVSKDSPLLQNGRLLLSWDMSL